MNFAGYILENSKARRDKDAVFHRDSTVTYQELYSSVLGLAGYLRGLPLQFQDKVALVSDNSIFFIKAYFGIMAAGLVAVPLSPDFGEANFTYVFSSCDIRCAFVQQKYLGRVAGFGLNPPHLLSDAAAGGAVDMSTVQGSAGDVAGVDAKENLATIIFTSGSTGIPKGVMLTHQNMAYNTGSIIEYLGLTPDDRIMVVLPFSYCFGTSLLHTHLRAGGSVVISKSFLPGKMLDEINEKRCTGLAGVPATFQILLRRSPIKKMQFPTLRYVQQAGGKLTNAFITELREALPTTRVFIMYGQTEATARLSYLPPEMLDAKLGSIGKGIPGTTIEVLGKDGKPVKPGETGEIVASGGNIMKGYWKDPEGTAKVIRGGKLYTGDLGTVDEDGYVYMTEREKDIIKSSGYRVSPKEIEDQISNLPEVVEVAVIGIPDEIMGEVPKAFVSLARSNSISGDDIIAYCRQHLPPFKVPKAVEFLPDLPKNTSNKLDKVKLREIEKARQGGQA
ncbi:MAG: AMP-binding protein [Candidatus Lokiarchaeota archaeon]|nr:AMP-binding protein [Candidatus Lokiarchaeota archaeon]